MTPPLVSIILPTFKRSKLIGYAISSVCAQTYTNWELIIVDDHSNDDTADVVGEYSTDKRIKYHGLAENRGASAARNVGINLSAGQLITFIDSDDRYRPEKVEKQVACITRSSHGGVVTCGRNDFHSNGTLYSTWIPVPLSKVVEQMFSDERVGAGTPFLMVTRNVVDAGVRFDENINVVEDFDFLAQVLLKGYPLAIVPEPLVDVYHYAVERNFNYDAGYHAREYLYVKYSTFLRSHPQIERRYLFKTMIFFAMSKQEATGGIQNFRQTDPVVFSLLQMAHRSPGRAVKKGLIKTAKILFKK